MQTNLVVRPARYDDPAVAVLTAEVQAYYRRLYGGEDTNPLSSAEFAPPSGGFLLGSVGDEPVAMGGWRRYDAESPVPGARPAEIRRMYVRPEHRGRGFARLLLTELERAAEADGADLMILETGTPQTEAIAFYTAAGYAPVPEFGHWAGWDNAVHLGRRLRDRTNTDTEDMQETPR